MAIALQFVTFNYFHMFLNLVCCAVMTFLYIDDDMKMTDVCFTSSLNNKEIINNREIFDSIHHWTHNTSVIGKINNNWKES